MRINTIKQRKDYERYKKILKNKTREKDIEKKDEKEDKTIKTSSKKKIRNGRYKIEICKKQRN